MQDGGRDDLSLKGRANQPVNAGQGELIRGGDERCCIPEYLCFAQLNSESVIVHIENLMRQDGSGASGSHQGNPLDCQLSHRSTATRI
jgi:hypothetical protein